jgi:hypothetical protein
MNIKDIARRARILWNNPQAPAHTNRHNRRSYIRSVINLGPRWVLSEPTNRPENPDTIITWRKP